MNWFTNLFKPNPYFTGVKPDDRTLSEQSKDYIHTERAPVETTDPFENVQMKNSPYPYQNQLGTSSCVPHAVGLAYAIERGLTDFVALSYTFAYRLRSNYAQEGSIISNIYDIYENTGAPLLTTLPTPQTETEANAEALTSEMFDEAKIYRGAKYFTISPPNDIGTIAQVAQQGHAVTLCLFATYAEYAQIAPVVSNRALLQANAEVQHEVCVLPYSGYLMNGIRYVAIQDSAWFGGYKLRYLSEDFIKTRVTDAKYWVGYQTLSSGVAPKYTFSSTLMMGSKGPDVLALQQLLVSQALLPHDCCTGLFGPITLAGVKAFQNRYAADILLPNGLLSPTGIFGLSSIKKANVLCQ